MTPTEETLAPAGDTAIETHDHDHDHDHAGHTHSHGPTLNPELTRTISVEAPAAEVDKAYNAAIKRYQKLARIPGFRAGKVPAALIRKRFARDLRQEVLEQLVNDRFRAALVEQNVQPVSQPQVSELLLAEGQPLKFQATFEVLPEFDPSGWETISVAKPDTALTDEEFEGELNSVLDHHATVSPVEEDRPLQDGDWAEIAFTGTVQELSQTIGEDGVENQSSEPPITGQDVLVEIGGKNTLQAFSDGLRGTRVGQELQLEVSYPADSGDQRLAGKTVSYDITVKAIKHKEYPQRDDEFAKELGAYESWADFETKLRERAQQRKTNALVERAKEDMLNSLVARYHFPLPESFVQQQVDSRLERGLRALAAQGMTSDAMRQMDFGRLREAQRDQAAQEVKASMVLDRIAQAENITVPDEDFERELLMASIQQREPLETLRARMQQDGTLDGLRNQLRRERAAAFLYDKLAK